MPPGASRTRLVGTKSPPAEELPPPPKASPELGWAVAPSTLANVAYSSSEDQPILQTELGRLTRKLGNVVKVGVYTCSHISVSINHLLAEIRS